MAKIILSNKDMIGNQLVQLIFKSDLKELQKVNFDFALVTGIGDYGPQKGVVIDMLLRSLIVGNGKGQRVNYDDLLLGDKNAVMVAARVLGYGAEYHVEIPCPACGHKQKEVVDLATLKNKDVEVVDNGNRFEFVLPLSKKTITFKILSHKDLDEQLFHYVLGIQYLYLKLFCQDL